MKPWLCSALALAALTTTASANPRARVDEIDRAVTAAVSRVDRLPADAAGTERLAADLTKVAGDARAALTPDLRVVGKYESVAEDVAKLPALAAAVRASWPCREAVQKIVAPADYKAAKTACATFATAALGTRLQTVASAVERELKDKRRSLADGLERQAKDTARAEGEAKLAAEQAGTVMGQLKDMTAEDAYRPDKIADAFQRVPADLVVSEPKPFSVHLEPLAGRTDACQSGDARAISTVWYHNGASSTVEIRAASGDSLVGVPLLVWQRTGKSGVVVSLDGLRYTTEDVDALVHGVPDRAGWPSAPRPLCLTPDMVTDAALSAKIAKAHDAVGACAARAWKSSNRALDANDAANITESTRANRRSAILDRGRNAVEAACAAPRKAFEAALLAASAAQAKTRAGALAAATAALAR